MHSVQLCACGPIAGAGTPDGAPVPAAALTPTEAYTRYVEMQVRECSDHILPGARCWHNARTTALLTRTITTSFLTMTWCLFLLSECMLLASPCRALSNKVGLPGVRLQSEASDLEIQTLGAGAVPEGARGQPAQRDPTGPAVHGDRGQGRCRARPAGGVATSFRLERVHRRRAGRWRCDALHNECYCSSDRGQQLARLTHEILWPPIVGAWRQYRCRSSTSRSGGIHRRDAIAGDLCDFETDLLILRVLSICFRYSMSVSRRHSGRTQSAQGSAISAIRLRL